MVDSEGRVNVEDQAQDRDQDRDEDADEAGGNASVQEISSAAKGQENLNQGLSCSELGRLWLQDDELREERWLVGWEWEEKREMELQKGRCRRKGGGLAEKRIRF